MTGSVAFAEDLPEISPTPTTSIGTISFTDDATGPVDPVDPTDPDKGGEDGDGDNSGNNALLSVDYASHFRFGEKKISTIDKTYNATPETIKVGENKDEKVVPTYVQVSDRRGTQEGWTLKATQNGAGFMSNKTNTQLEGAKLSFNNAVLATGADNGDMLTTNYKKSFSLEPGVSQNVISMEEDKGVGTFVLRFDNSDDSATTADNYDGVSLFVPKKAKQLKEVYSTTIEWTLENGPQNLVQD